MIIATENTSPLTVSYPENNKQLLKLFFVLIGYSLLFGIVDALILLSLKPLNLESDLLNSLVMLITYSLIFIYTIKYVRKHDEALQSVRKELTGYTFTASTIFVITIATISLAILLDPLTSFIPVPIWFEELMKDMLSKNIFAFVGVAIAAPLFEEWLCRGILLKGLLKRHSPLKAILISSAFFSLMHLNPWQGIPAFFIGLFLGLLYYQSKSIWPGIIAHSVNNAACFFLVHYLPADKQSLLSITGPQYYLPLIGVGILVFACSCALLIEFYHRSKL